MVATWVDFKDIKQRARIADVLARYGVLEKLQRRGENLVGSCPIHKGTNGTQFHVSLAKNNFNCFGDCHGGGNVIDFVAKMEGVDTRAAALKLQEWFGIGDGGEKENGKKRLVTKDKPDKATGEGKREQKDERVEEKTEERVNPPLTFVLKNLDPEYPYLAERGFTQETIATFGVGHCKKGLMAGRIVIPIHNERGELIAYAGRWPGDPPDGEGKYKLPAGFHKSLVVFNLFRAKEYAREHGLILVEGFFDCIHLWQAGVRNVVALMGSSLSPEQEVLIVEAVGSNGRVALMLDEDESGWKGRKDALTRLSAQVYVKVIVLGEGGRQPDSLTVEELRSLGLL